MEPLYFSTMSDEKVFDFGKKRKGDKKKKKDVEESKEDENFERGEIYTYATLLTRVHETIEKLNPGIGAKQKYVMKPPQIVRVGSKRVAWVNFGEVCELMKRNPEHVFQFFMAEFGTTGSLGGNNQMIFKGRFNAKHVESLLRKYITEYVTCAMCKSANTTLNRDSNTRLYTINCSSCGAFRTVNTIKSGFHATTKADRRAKKMAA